MNSVIASPHPLPPRVFYIKLPDLWGCGVVVPHFDSLYQAQLIVNSG